MIRCRRSARIVTAIALLLAAGPRARAEDTVVIDDRALSWQQRSLLSLGGSALANDSTAFAGYLLLGYEYHPREVWGFGLQLGWGGGVATSNPYEVFPGQEITRSWPLALGLVTAIWSPIYGKWLVAGSVVHHAISFELGGGAVAIHVVSPETSAFVVNPAATIGTRLDIGLGPHAALELFARGVLYSEHVLGPGPPPAADVAAVRFQLLLGASIAVLFPGIPAPTQSGTTVDITARQVEAGRVLAALEADLPAPRLRYPAAPWVAGAMAVLAAAGGVGAWSLNNLAETRASAYRAAVNATGQDATSLRGQAEEYQTLTWVTAAGSAVLGAVAVTCFGLSWLQEEPP